MRGAWRQTEIVDLHRQGLSVSEIAEAIGWQDSDVTRALRAARARGDLPELKTASDSAAEWRAKALADWETGKYLIVEISRRVGMSPSAVSRCLRQACGDRGAGCASIACAPIKHDAVAPTLGIRVGKVVVKREPGAGGGIERRNVITLSGGISRSHLEAAE